MVFISRWSEDFSAVGITFCRFDNASLKIGFAFEFVTRSFVNPGHHGDFMFVF